jgi:hypothetical protein
MIVDVPTEIPTGHHPDASQKFCNASQLALCLQLPFRFVHTWAKRRHHVSGVYSLPLLVLQSAFHCAYIN